MLANHLEIMVKAGPHGVDQTVASVLINEAAARLREHAASEAALRQIIRKIECICGEVLERNVVTEDIPVVLLVQELADYARRS